MAKSETEIIRANYEKAKHVAEKIVTNVHAGVYPFDEPELFPDAIVPKGMKTGSLEHALFLFHSINVDSARSSEIVYQTFRDLVAKIPLQDLPEMNLTKLEIVLSEPFKSFGNPETARDNPIQILSHNAKKLQKEYDGDPRNLLGASVEETLRNICYGRDKTDKFIQYRQGKAKLLLKNFIRFGIWPFSEFEIPIKVDRHNLRISLGMGVIESGDKITRGRSEKVNRVLADVYLEVTQQERISAVDLNDGMWATGKYHCIKNNSVHCEGSCKMGCKLRPRLDERASYFSMSYDVRKEANQLCLDLG